MYAVIEVGAKQYSVKIDDIIDVEKFKALEGKEIALDRVLLAGKGKDVQVGTPYLKGAKVSALVVGTEKGGKAVSFKYRRRKSKHWKAGHRQKLVRLKIKEITVG